MNGIASRTKHIFQVRKVVWIAGASLLGLAILWWAAARPYLESMLRARMIDFLEDRMASQVELGPVKLSLVPHIGVTGEAFVFRHHGRIDLPPLIRIRRFEARVSPWGIFRSPRHVRQVRLEGLQIHVPPRGQQAPKRSPQRKSGGSSGDVIVDEIIADGSFLQILPQQADKLPHDMNLYRLTIESASATRPMTFRATLSNPKPPGLIVSTGRFGPWQKDEPSLTPVSGDYRFEHADLSVFRTIAGILSSRGHYQGVLENIEVDGDTDVPDFQVKAAAHPVHLRTRFHAVVDGTNGDTRLEPVAAEFLRSRITACGAVTQVEGVRGKTVILDVTATQARMEDLLKLGVKSAVPPMTGAVDLHTAFRLPPGKVPTSEKLFLDGDIRVRSGHFTNPKVQAKVNQLSEKGRGDDQDRDKDKASADDTPERVVSNLRARFRVDRGVIHISDLYFEVPGARVSIRGNCGMRSRELDFRGTLRLDAKLSETTTGIKSFLLKLVDPFFKNKKKGSGAQLPIKVTGTLQKPSFGLNLGGKSPSEVNP